MGECPEYDNEEILRFGNHDRLGNPKDCQQFFSCLRTGQPRLGACPKKTVFNEATGHCDDPNNVKGCENYWKDKEKDEFNEYYDYRCINIPCNCYNGTKKVLIEMIEII